METSSGMAGRWLSLWLMVGVLLLGAALLLHDLDGRSLWVDEGWSVAASSQPNLATVTRMVAADVHPPLHLAGLHVWQRLAGDTVFALRLSSALTVMIAAALVYRLGRALFGAGTGLLAALLFVLHDLILVLGGEIRQYPLSQLLTVLVIWQYWRWWRMPDGAPSPRQGLGFVLAGAALLWTVYWGGLVLLALFVHWLISRWPRVWPGLLAFAGIALAFAPWMPVLLRQIDGVGAPGLGHALPASRLGYEVLAFQLLGRPEWFWGGLALAGLFDLRARRSLLSTAGALLGWVAAVTVGLSIVVNLYYPTLSFRMLSLVIPALALLAAHAISRLPALPRMTLAGVAIALTVALPAARHPIHLPWDAVAAFVGTHSAAGDAVLVETWFDTYAFVYYLDRQAGDLAIITSDLDRRERSPEAFAAHISAALEDRAGAWVVRFSPDADIRPLLVASDRIASDRIASDRIASDWVETGRVEWRTDLSPIELLRFDRLSPSPQVSPVTVFGDVLQLDSFTVTQRDDWLTLSLLWQPVLPPPVDYSVSAFLLNADGVLVAQNDSFPLANHAPTRAWQVGGHYFDSHALPTANLPAGNYRLGLKVYAFTDTSFQTVEILPPAICAPDCEFATLADVRIASTP